MWLLPVIHVVINRLPLSAQQIVNQSSHISDIVTVILVEITLDGHVATTQQQVDQDGYIGDVDSIVVVDVAIQIVRLVATGNHITLIGEDVDDHLIAGAATAAEVPVLTVAVGVEAECAKLKPAVESLIETPVHVVLAIGVNTVKHPCVTVSEVNIVISNGTACFQLLDDEVSPLVLGEIVAVVTVVGGSETHQLHIALKTKEFKCIPLVIGVSTGRGT